MNELGPREPKGAVPLSEERGTSDAGRRHHQERPEASGTSAARFGVLGGTLDPVHLGHLVAASEAGHVLGLDEVIFVPAGSPGRSSAGSSRPPRTGTR